MSEEILKALMQLFAIITKQDEGVSSGQRKYVEEFLIKQLNQEAVEEYLDLYDDYSGYNKDEEKSELSAKQKLTSVKDSVRTLAICKKINKTLEQKQKVVVLVRLLELVNADKVLSKIEMEIVDTVATVFRIRRKEFEPIKNFVLKEDPYAYDSSDILNLDGIKDNQKALENGQGRKHIYSEELQGCISILRVPSADLYFVKYVGQSDILLNGLALNHDQIYMLANGSTIKVPKGAPIYYSDIIAHFMSEFIDLKLSFKAKNVEFKFPNGNIGLRDINMAEEGGKLVGLMGASGAGKTTLLNVLNGIDKPTKGEVIINGCNLHEDKDKTEGVIGYIPQDDLLMEELTVYQNLYYNAKLCFKHLSRKEIDELVVKTLKDLGLIETKNLRVGNALEKTISGGQRKRLNIGLELIREPSILFVDEPTSGLSSRDSENIMDLLKELTLKGKLIFVVIHQPSSDIFKMFDKLVILDVGGYPVYYGNPVEAVMYFKRLAKQINSDRGECPDCGKVDPELIFNIIETKLVDDYGNYTEERKIKPEEWYDHYKNSNHQYTIADVNEAPPRSLNIPSRIKQLIIFITRDVLSKVKNKQYMLINFLEAPVLAFMLAYIIRYIDDPKSDLYLYSDNENIPAYLFMAIIVALFMGLTVSAEEIIRDKKIRKREAFLHLSRSSYLFSKISILFTISAIQTLTFAIIGNLILGIREMDLQFWMVLFTTSCFANVLGLNISASFNSAVTIYIVIPLILIPQMILSGALFSFDKLNRTIGGRRDRVPLLAEIMVSRWAFEAMAVKLFKDNRYQKLIYEQEKKESISDFKQLHLIPKLIKKVDECERNYKSSNDYLQKSTEENLLLLRNEIAVELKIMPKVKFGKLDLLTKDKFDDKVAKATRDYLNILMDHHIDQYNDASAEKENKLYALQNTPAKKLKYKFLVNAYWNESLSDLVKKKTVKLRIIEENNHFIQQVDPIYLDPVNIGGPMDFRAHFYAPRKHFFGKLYDTFKFNICFIWAMTILLYLTLYFDGLKRLLSLFEKKGGA